MLLLIQIPCLNEEETLPQTLVDLPRTIPGVDRVEILVIDDGSSDRTAQIARQYGAHHVIRNSTNRGLAASYSRGIDECLRLGADIIVNTDGDNQYSGADIAKLVAPIVAGRADIVIGDRQTGKIAHFSRFKRVLQRLGSLAVSTLSGAKIPDAVSGFRAMSREAALKFNVISPFSYTIETVLQAGRKKLKIVSVPVATNAATRESRLFTNIPSFVSKQLKTLILIYVMYSPLRAFSAIGLALGLLGMFPIARFLWLYMNGDGAGHLQSLVLGGVLCVMSFIAFTAGLLADVVSRNRQLLEITLEKIRRMELEKANALPSEAEPGDQSDTTPAARRAQG